MSGLREIIEWIEREWIFNPENDVDVEFERISKDFEDNDRSALADILRDDTPEFFKFLESELSRARAEPQADEEIRTLERRAKSLESRIEEIQFRIEEGVDTLIKQPTSIIGKVTNFIRGLFR